jgi:hypothetical protein
MKGRAVKVGAATWGETALAAAVAGLLGLAAVGICYHDGYLLLYGDAVAHLGIARRVYDSRTPGLMQLVGVWLPLPHLLMLPFVQKMEWWQTGLAGAWPSLICYVAGVAGFFRLCGRMLAPRWAWVATAFYGLNPNLLYLATTPMTEALFLALLVWTVLMTLECVDALGAGAASLAARRMVCLGVLIFLGVFARYDGWVLGAAAWCVVAWQMARVRGWGSIVGVAFAALTALAIAGPALWLGLEQHVFGDALWFLRGPYSAAALQERLGSSWPRNWRNYPGLHSPGAALLRYMRTAQLDAAAWETGFAVMAAALAGVWIALRRRMGMSAALLWVPLGFYGYAISYGSVPIFVPQLWPHTYYNARYGMELLPALALYACVALADAETRVARGRLMYGAVVGLVGVNALGMVYGPGWVQGTVRLVLHHPSEVAKVYTPLVVEEAVASSAGRVDVERKLARVLEGFPPDATILMSEVDHLGALQDAGIALRRTVNQNDLSAEKLAQDAPAREARYVVAFAGDAVEKAVAERPEGLQEMTKVCGIWTCARVYRSTEYGER